MQRSPVEPPAPPVPARPASHGPATHAAPALPRRVGSARSVPGVALAATEAARRLGDALAARWAPRPRDLGRHALDRETSDALAHLGGRSGAELLRFPTFDAAPDPTPALDREARDHRALPAPADPTPLRVLTFNCALLDRRYLGSRLVMPELEARRRVLPDRLFRGGWDVLFLQEVWDDADRARLQAAASGYRLLHGTRAGRRSHGLLLAVRESLIRGPEGHREAFFDAGYALERWPGPGLRRGWLEWRFRHAPSGRRIALVATHWTPFAPFWRQRALQARELGLAVNETDLVLAGGDLNAAPFCLEDTWPVPGGPPVRERWRGVIPWALLRHYGGLQDVAALGGLAADVASARALRRDVGRSRERPFGVADQAEPHAFTTTDRNSLCFRLHGSQDGPNRIDHLLLRDARRAVRVERAALAFTEPVDFGTQGAFELSDHYGVEADLLLERAPRRRRGSGGRPG